MSARFETIRFFFLTLRPRPMMQPAAAVPITKAIDLQPSASVQLTLIPAAGTSWIHRTRPNTRRGKQLGGNSYGIKVMGKDLGRRKLLILLISFNILYIYVAVVILFFRRK